MKSLAIVLLLSAAACLAADTRPEIGVVGRVDGIEVAPGGALWIVTLGGQAWRSDDGARTWSAARVPVRQENPYFTGDALSRIAFFDAAHAMIAGYIGEHNDVVFLTADGGATWHTARLPRSTWVYDARATSDGHGWLVGSEGDVLRSDDFGATWTELRRPFAKEERTSAVDFRTVNDGAVGALFSGALATTADGGATWTPFDANDVTCSDRRVTHVRLGADRVFIAQCGRVFVSPIAPPRKWTAVTAGGRPLTTFDLAPNGDVVGVASDLRVYRIARGGEARAIGGPLERAPLSVTAAGRIIAIVDLTMKVTIHDGAAWTVTRMFGKGTATSWPIETLDRGRDNVLWGVSRFFLYRSTDGAVTWERIAELPRAAAGVAVQDNGDVLLWDSHGWVGRWSVAAAKLADVPVLDGLDVVGSFRRRDVWLLCGGRQYDTQRRVEVARTYFAGQFEGSVDYGFVAASTDGGATWTIVDRWRDEGPQALFLGDDNRLVLVSWLGGVRRGTLTLHPPAAAMRTIVDATKAKSPAYAERVKLIDFLRPHDAWIGGWIHHLGDVQYPSRDGGKTWTPSNDHPLSRLFRLYDGRWIGIASNSIERWTGSTFETLAPLPKDWIEAWVDGAGTLMIRLDGGGLRVLDGNALRGVSAARPRETSRGTPASPRRRGST